MQVLWLLYLTEIDKNTETVPEELLANEQVSKALTELQVSAFTDKQLEGYPKEYVWWLLT